MSNKQPHLFVVVSGIPASGKTTLGRELARKLSLPYLDKDEFLEAMFERDGIGDMAWRKKLSRASDKTLERLAKNSTGAVVTSFWRNANMEGDSGTLVDWLRELPGKVIEVYCQCGPKIAVARFKARQRHPGHLDSVKSTDGMLEQFRRHTTAGALGIGKLVTVDTGKAYDLDAVVLEVRQKLGC